MHGSISSHGMYACSQDNAHQKFDKCSRVCTVCKSKLVRLCSYCNHYYTASNFSKHNRACARKNSSPTDELASTTSSSPPPLSKNSNQTTLPSISSIIYPDPCLSFAHHHHHHHHHNHHPFCTEKRPREHNMAELQYCKPFDESSYTNNDYEVTRPTKKRKLVESILSDDERKLYTKKTNMIKALESWELYSRCFEKLQTNKQACLVTRGDTYFCPSCCVALETRDSICVDCETRAKKFCSTCKIPFSDSALSKHKKDCVIVQQLSISYPQAEIKRVWEIYLKCGSNREETVKQLISEYLVPMNLTITRVDPNYVTCGENKAQVIYLACDSSAYNHPPKTESVNIQMIHSNGETKVASMVTAIIRDTVENILCAVVCTRYVLPGDYSITITVQGTDNVIQSKDAIRVVSLLNEFGKQGKMSREEI